MLSAAILTQHGKERVVAPALRVLGVTLNVVHDFDTDTLGTFTRERARIASQIDTAIQKAKLACEHSGMPYGLGSEGAFSPDPYAGLTAWNTEVMAWWDQGRQYAVVAHHASPLTNYGHQIANHWLDAERFAIQKGFPAHALIVGRPGEAVFRKGIADHDEYRTTVRQALQSAPQVWIETDMRAHLNPMRMQAIGKLAEKLALRLQSTCPACGLAGFGPHRPVMGALCASCGTATRIPRAEIWQCPACGHETEHTLNKLAEAQHCPSCNP